MKHRPIYRGDGYVLGICQKCERTNYVEPHGLTAPCACQGRRKNAWVPHSPIPENQRIHGMMGPYVLVKDDNRLKGNSE